MGNTTGRDAKTLSELEALQKQIMTNQLDIQRMQINNLHQIQGLPNAHKSTEFSQQYQQNGKQQYEHSELLRKRLTILNIINNNRQSLTNDQLLKIQTLLSRLNVQLGFEPNAGINPVGNEIGQQSFNYGTTKIGISEGLGSGSGSGSGSHKNDKLYKYDYETQEELEKKDYERKQAKLKQEYLESQRRRKIKFQEKMMELQSKKNEAFKLFGLNKNFNNNDLKRSYKRLALNTHPDKFNGDDTRFKLVTEYYFLLKSYLNEQEEFKPHTEFKKEYNKSKHIDKNVIKDKMSLMSDGSGFNIKLFNQVFEENKIYDETQEGYEDWLKGDSDSKQPELFSKKFNLDVFNDTFEQHKEDNPNNQIIEYKEPQALISSDSLGYCLDIDNTKGSGFTKYIGAGSAGGIGYCDLKQAYTNSNLISTTKASRNEYKNIDELERDRANIRYDMTPEELAEMALKKQREDAAEQIRLERIKEKDFLSAKHYSNVHERLLGYKANPEF